MLTENEYTGLENGSAHAYVKCDSLRIPRVSEVSGFFKIGRCSHGVLTELARLRGSDTSSLCGRWWECDSGWCLDLIWKLQYNVLRQLISNPTSLGSFARWAVSQRINGRRNYNEYQKLSMASLHLSASTSCLINLRVFFFLIFKFIYFFWESARAHARMRICTCTLAHAHKREEQRPSPAVSACQRRAHAGLESLNPEIMTWAEIKSCVFNWLSHPGALNLIFSCYVASSIPLLYA